MIGHHIKTWALDGREAPRLKRVAVLHKKGAALPHGVDDGDKGTLTELSQEMEEMGTDESEGPLQSES